MVTEGEITSPGTMKDTWDGVVQCGKNEDGMDWYYTL